MTDEERAILRRKLIEEGVSLLASLLLVVALTLLQRHLTEPDFFETQKRRLRKAVEGEGERAVRLRQAIIDSEVARFATDVSNWEHEQAGR